MEIAKDLSDMKGERMRRWLKVRVDIEQLLLLIEDTLRENL